MALDMQSKQNPLKNYFAAYMYMSTMKGVSNLNIYYIILNYLGVPPTSVIAGSVPVPPPAAPPGGKGFSTADNSIAGGLMYAGGIMMSHCRRMQSHQATVSGNDPPKRGLPHQDV